MWRYNILFLFILGGCSYTWAQNVAFIASPGASRMGVKDQIQFTLTIRNVENLTELKPTSWGDFRPVDGPFQSQSVSITNGARSSSISLTYIIQPTHEGRLTIPAAFARDAAGHTYQSNPVTIEVVPGSLAPRQQPRRQPNMFDDDEDPFAMMQQQMARLQQMQQAQMQRMQQMQQMQRGGGAAPAQPGGRPGTAQAEPPIDNEAIKKDLFIKVIVDKNKVHLGEQVTTSYKLYSRIPMQAGITKLPNLDGFWTQDFEIPQQPKPTEEIVDGKKYQVFLLKKSALFPQQTGSLELDPAEAKGVARILQTLRQNPFGGTLMMNDPFFNNSFFNTVAYRDVNVELKSIPVKINVVPLPDKGKPADFGGAVGKFSIAAKLDKKEFTTDDVASLTLTISGSGNFKLIEAPKFTLPNGIGTYDPVIVDTITSRSTVISGSKVITYVVTPQTAGDYEIPAIPFSYFDPQSGAYVTLHTEPIRLTVKPGKNYNPARVTGNSSMALKDIHDNASGALMGAVIKPYIQSPGYWSLYVVPVLAFTGLLLWRRRSDAVSGDMALVRHKRANKIALQRLVTAKKLLQQNQKVPFYEEVSKAIWLYLSDKLRIQLSSLSRDTATAALTERNVPVHIQKQIESVIWDCETALYASSGSNQMTNTYDAAVKVISDLEGVI